MKKIGIGILITVFLLSMGTISAFAAGPRTRWNFVDSNGNNVYNNCSRYYKSCMENTNYGACFVDTNGDGVCDNYMDMNSDNICDNCNSPYESCPAGNKCGMNFVDTNNDGICDNYMDMDNDNICDNCNASYGNCPAGNGCGINFADTNNDGVCDNYMTGSGAGNGYGAHCGGRGNGFRGGCRRNR